MPSHWTSCCWLCVSPRSGSVCEEISTMAPVGLCDPRAHASCPVFCRRWLCTVMRQLRPHRALCMCVTRCVLGRGLPCEVHLYGPHHDSSGSGRTGVTLERPHGYVVWGDVMAAATAAASARREWTCLQALRLLVSSSSLLAHALPTLGSAKSANARQLASSTGAATHHSFIMAIFDAGCIRGQLSSVASGSAFSPNICWPNVYSLCWGCCYERKQNILCDETVINPPKMSTSHVFFCFAGRAYPSLRDSHAACIWFICLNMESSKELQGILPQCSLRLAKTILQESWAVTKMNWTLFNWDILKLPRAWGLL